MKKVNQFMLESPPLIFSCLCLALAILSGCSDDAADGSADGAPDNVSGDRSAITEAQTPESPIEIVDLRSSRFEDRENFAYMCEVNLTLRNLLDRPVEIRSVNIEVIDVNSVATEQRLDLQPLAFEWGYYKNYNFFSIRDDRHRVYPITLSVVTEENPNGGRADYPTDWQYSLANGERLEKRLVLSQLISANESCTWRARIIFETSEGKVVSDEFEAVFGVILQDD